MRTLSFQAMGCSMRAVLDQDTPGANERLQKIPLWFEEWEQILSRFRPDSELNRVNASVGQPMKVSKTFWEVLQAALRASQQSDGMVIPTLLEALERAGYDRSFDLISKNGAQEKAGFQNETRTNIRASTITVLDEADHVIQLSPGTHLDFGGIAKGWAAHQAMLRLRPYAPSLVDASGDIAISGLKSDGQPWPVGIVDPFHPQEDLELLMLGHGGVATSGRDFRRWKQNGTWQHHIVDPRTGKPAVTDVLSATVIAPDVCQAEMSAKKAMILGSQAGIGWLDARPALAAVLVLDDGQILQSKNIDRYLWR